MIDLSVVPGGKGEAFKNEPPYFEFAHVETSGPIGETDRVAVALVEGGMQSGKDSLCIKIPIFTKEDREELRVEFPKGSGRMVPCMLVWELSMAHFQSIAKFIEGRAFHKFTEGGEGEVG